MIDWAAELFGMTRISNDDSKLSQSISFHLVDITPADLR